jgi:hypothetical protein
MVTTRTEGDRLFGQETRRLARIQIESSYYSEFSINPIVYRPIFESVMEEQFMNTLAKEQIKALTKFGGSAKEDVIKWLHDIEEVFDRARIQPSNKYLAVQSYLVDAAAKWFRYNKAVILEWSSFKIEIVKAYQPSFHQTLLTMEQRQQLTGESVMEYYHDKIHLCSHADPNMSSSMILHYLTKGLHNSLIPHVIRRHPTTPIEFLTVAQDEEKIQLTLNGFSHASTASTDYYPNDDTPIDNMVTLVKRPNDIHLRSNHQQHNRSFPPPLMTLPSAPAYISSSSRRSYHQDSSSPSVSRQCYECYRFGHIAKHCPNRKNM